MKYISYRTLIFVLFIIIIPLILVNVEKKSSGENLLFKWSAETTNFLKLQYSSFSNSITYPISQYLHLLEVKKENRRLSIENQELKIQHMRLKQLSLQNDRLYNTLQFKNKSSLNLMAAKVISFDPFQSYHLIQINKGRQDGIQNHMLAVTEAGVVGSVLRTRKYTSDILLLSDRNIIIPATVERSRVSGLVSGIRRNILEFKYLKNSDDVVKGDLVVTTSLNRGLPAGLRIGTVTKIKKNEYSLSQVVHIEPAVRLSEIEELFIIMNQSKPLESE